MADVPKKILMYNSKRGLVGGVERLLLNLSKLLAKKGWQVYGLFEEIAREDADFDACFYDIRMLDQANLESHLCYYQAEGLRLICYHKINNSNVINAFNQVFASAVIVHDHDFYCLRRHKYFPYRRKNCHLPFSSFYCPLCSGMIEKIGGEIRRIDLNERKALLEAVRDCDISFVLSQAMQKNLLINGWDASKIRYLVPFQDLKEPLEKPVNETLQILFVGQLIRGKGVDLLLKAAALLKGDFKLIIQGQGNDLEFLKELAHELGISDKLVFQPFNSQLDEVYRSSDILVVPSRWQEPFGLVGLEAFAHQLPVVAFDVGGISQWLKHKVNGLLVLERDYRRLAKAIQKLLDEPQLRKRYGEKGRKMVEKYFNRESFAASLLPVFEELYFKGELADGAPPSKMRIPLWQKLIAGLFSLCFSLPAYLFSKKTEKLEIHHPRQKSLSITLLNSKNWLLRHSLLYPLVLRGHLKLVGTSFWPGNEPEAPADIAREIPGIFNLHFIRSSSKMPMNSQEANDREYLQRKGLLYDFLIFIQALFASSYHQHDFAMQPKLDIFDVRLANLSMQEAIDLIDSGLKANIQREIFFVNADCLNKTFRDPEYYQILKDSKILFPDGSGINLAAKLLGGTLKENLNGTDLLPQLCELAQEKGYSIYLLGAKEGVARAAAENLQALYPKLKIAGTHHGYFDWDGSAESVIEQINSSKADILLVAFGAPYQEKFITKYRRSLKPGLLMGVGGLFDFYSFQMPRAPLWMRQLGIEWIFRLWMEPKRMWKRYIIGNPLFIYRVWRWKKAGEKKP